MELVALSDLHFDIKNPKDKARLESVAKRLPESDVRAITERFI